MNTEHLAKMQAIFDDLFLEKVKVTPELDATQVEEWDSVMHVSLIIEVEQTFGVRFRTGEVGSMRNIGDLLTLIERRLQEP